MMRPEIRKRLIKGRTTSRTLPKNKNLYFHADPSITKMVSNLDHTIDILRPMTKIEEILIKKLGFDQFHPITKPQENLKIKTIKRYIHQWNVESNQMEIIPVFKKKYQFHKKPQYELNIFGKKKEVRVRPYLWRRWNEFELLHQLPYEFKNQFPYFYSILKEIYIENEFHKTMRKHFTIFAKNIQEVLNQSITFLFALHEMVIQQNPMLEYVEKNPKLKTQFLLIEKYLALVIDPDVDLKEKIIDVDFL